MRKFVCVSLIIVLLMTSAVLFVACNKEEEVTSTGEFLKDVANVATRPSDFDSLFDAAAKSAIEKGVAEAQKSDDDES